MIKTYLKSQFGHPRGFMGRLAGIIMAKQNAERLAWAEEFLQVQPSDHVLEVGFGPGLGIEMAAKMAAQVTGIDISAVMLEQAKARNAAMIQSGRVALHQGTVEHIPYPAAHFDLIFTANTLHHWDNVERGLREVHRVLKPDGRLAIIEQPAYGEPERHIIEQRGSQLENTLRMFGFEPVRTEYGLLGRGWALCTTARRPITTFP